MAKKEDGEAIRTKAFAVQQASLKVFEAVYKKAANNADSTNNTTDASHTEKKDDTEKKE